MIRTCASAALGILALAACKTAPAKSPLVAGHAVPANGLPTDGTITHELAPLLMGRVVLDRDVDVAAHSATLVSTLIEEDASCTDDPPDYEQDYNRYYECHQVDDARTWEAEGVAATPLAAATAWRKRAVTLYGATGALCNGVTHGDSGLFGRWRTSQTSLTAQAGASDDAMASVAAQAVLQHNQVLLTTIDAPCLAKAIVVRDQALPPLEVWSFERADAMLVAAVARELSPATAPTLAGSAILSNATATPVDALPVVFSIRSPHGRRHLVIGQRTETDCNGANQLGGIWEVTGTATHPVLRELVRTALDHEDSQFAPTFVADLDRDGWPDIVTDQGVHVTRADEATYVQWIKFDDVFDGPWCGD